MDQITVINRLGRGGCVVTALALTLPASGQTAYYSLQGNLNAAGGQYDFNFGLSRTVGSGEDVRFVTYASGGGTNSAGDTVASGGIDSVLELTDSTLFLHGFNDDASGLDSLIGWTQPSGTALNPNPLPVESYRLNLMEFGNNAAGAWAVDLVAPADAIALTGVTPTGSATATSLKFGTDSATGAAATFNQIATLNLTGALTVAQTGKAAFNNATGTTTVGGLTTVNAGGLLDITGGSFAANGGVSLNGGTLTAATSSFSLAAGQSFTATNNAQATLSGADFYIINGNRSFGVNTGADLMLDGAININGGASAVIDGAGSSLTTNSTILGTVSDVGSFGSAGTLTVRNNATAALEFLDVASVGGTAPTTSGTVNVQSGADLTLLTLSIVYVDTNTGSGLVNVTGNGSSITQTGAASLIVGNNVAGTATLNVQDAGVFSTGLGGATINKTGTLNINSAGVFNANADMTINGGTLSRNGGTFNLAAGKNLTASNNGQVLFASDYTIGNASTFTIQSGADLSSNSYIDIGTSTNGMLVVDGAGSTLTTGTTSSFWGSDGATADVTLRNGATATLGGPSLQIGRSGTANTHATVNIQTGAELTVNSIRIGVDGSAGGTAVLTVDDATVTQNGVSILTLGHAIAGTATINVQNDGEFTTGTGLTTINKTGTLNVSSFYGFTAKGDVNVVGGTIDVENGNGDDNRFNLAAGKTLTATQQAQIDFLSSYQIGNGVTFNINDGSDFRSGTLEVGLHSTGTMNVDGMGSSLTLNNPASGQLPTVGGYGGAGTLTIRNKANATIDDELLITAGGNSNTNGTVNIQTGATLNADDIRIITDSSQGTGTLTIDGAGSTLTQNGASVLDIGEAGAPGDAIVNITNNGTLNAGTGAVTINANGTVNLNGGTLNATTIDYTHGGFFNFYSGRLSVDTFDGYLDQQGGVLAPGNSPGITEITNGYFNNGGTIEIELDGLTAGAGFDQVQITGNAHLGAGSVLDVVFPNAFTYMKGDSLVILQADSLSGAFNSVNFAANPGAAFGVVYGATTVTLLAGLPGDLNNDGFVGIEDLNIVLGNWNSNVTPGVWGQGDPTGDGFIGIEDLNQVLGNWNTGTPPTATASIPEPGAVMLFACGLVGFARRRAG